MYILGLGSNLNNRIENLRNAYQAIKAIPGMIIENASPVYFSQAQLPDNAPTSWNQFFFNAALKCHINLEPEKLLAELKGIELLLGRNTYAEKWSPRIIDIDILAWDERTIATDALTIPHPHLIERPFALWPLADLIPNWRHPLSNHSAAELAERFGSRYAGQLPLYTQQIPHRIDTPQLMGILNVTADSFSDGGKFLEKEPAFQQALHLTDSGADIIDIGAESTAPNAMPLTEEEEWRRLEPVLAALDKYKNTFHLIPKISVDTRHASVAEKALAYNIDWINDVTGLDDPAMRDIVRHSGLPCVIMHHLSIPENRNNVLSRSCDTVATVLQWGKTRLQELEKAGLDIEKIIFDPGIGFGKLADQSLLLLQNVAAFKELGTRILIGHSRKSFMANFTPHQASERDLETTITSLFLAKQPIDYLRIHNVDMISRAFRTWHTISATAPQPCEMSQTPPGDRPLSLIA